MTKRELAKTILQMVDNFRYIGDSEDQIVAAIESVLEPLEPKDPSRFAQWGLPHQRVPTPDPADQ